MLIQESGINVNISLDLMTFPTCVDVSVLSFLYRIYIVWKYSSLNFVCSSRCRFCWYVHSCCNLLIVKLLNTLGIVVSVYYQ